MRGPRPLVVDQNVAGVEVHSGNFCRQLCSPALTTTHTKPSSTCCKYTCAVTRHLPACIRETACPFRVPQPARTSSPVAPSISKSTAMIYLRALPIPSHAIPRGDAGPAFFNIVKASGHGVGRPAEKVC